jgi:hypothetical protein
VLACEGRVLRAQAREARAEISLERKAKKWLCRGAALKVDELLERESGAFPVVAGRGRLAWMGEGRFCG